MNKSTWRVTQRPQIRGTVTPEVNITFRGPTRPELAKRPAELEEAAESFRESDHAKRVTAMTEQLRQAEEDLADSEKWLGQAQEEFRDGADATDLGEAEQSMHAAKMSITDAAERVSLLRTELDRSYDAARRAYKADVAEVSLGLHQRAAQERDQALAELEQVAGDALDRLVAANHLLMRADSEIPLGTILPPPAKPRSDDVPRQSAPFQQMMKPMADRV